MAHLYADAFDATPDQDLIRHRYSAARAAAMAGCGRGDDAAKLGDFEREKWRTQARSWLRAELADWKKLLDNNLAKATKRDMVRQNLTFWQTDADLAGLREPAELLKLPADERKDLSHCGTTLATSSKQARRSKVMRGGVSPLNTSYA
jgi:eukaryotic-like serine/threonine-protein kinase